MQFSGLDKAELDDLYELNRGFLEFLESEYGSQTILSGVPESITARLQSLSREERRRLALTPFLLCSCHEDDVEYWRRLLGPGESDDLFEVAENPDSNLLRLTSAVISFTWQLARKNVFVARLLTGASSAWCEETAAKPILHLIEGGCRRKNSLRLRLAEDGQFWERLLMNAVSDDPLIRRAARAGGLQRILLMSGTPTRLLLAAKSSTSPRQRRTPP